MAFTLDSDPIEDLQIGTIEASFDRKELRKLSLDTLNKLYDRVHEKTEANVLVDGKEYNTLTYFEKLNLNNSIVDAINYKNNIERRDNARALNLQKGDVIKVKIRNKLYLGCPQFSKRGLLRTDSRGRIIGITQNGRVFRVTSNIITIVKGQEKKDFLKKYKENYFDNQKAYFKRILERYNDNIYFSSRYKKIEKEYEVFLSNSPFTK